MSLPSGSRWERAFACEASCVLPTVETSGVYAARGTSIHDYLANVGTIGREAALARIADRWRETCSALDLDELPQVDPTRYVHEIAFAYNVKTRTARELHRGGGRDYSDVGEWEIPLTLDVFGLGVVAGTGVVIDWKSGYKAVACAKVNRQLQAAALAVSALYGLDYVKVAIGYIREGGRPWFDYDDFDALDLAELGDEFEEQGERLVEAQRRYAAIRAAHGIDAANREARAHVGDHCRNCPSYTHCPATWGLVRAFATAPGAAMNEVRDCLAAPDVARLAVVKLKAVKQLIGQVEGAVRAYAEDVGGIDMGNGTKWGPVVGSVEVVDGATAYRVIAEEGADLLIRGGREPATAREEAKAIAEKTVTFKTTKTAIERASREIAAALNLKIAKTNRALLDAIRRRGGITEKPRTEFDYFPANDQVPAKALPAADAGEEIT